MEDLENSYTQGGDRHPKTVNEAYKILKNLKHNPKNIVQMVHPTTNSTAGKVEFVNYYGNKDNM